MAKLLIHLLQDGATEIHELFAELNVSEEHCNDPVRVAAALREAIQ